MLTKRTLLAVAAAVAIGPAMTSRGRAQVVPRPLVRWTELVVDPAQLDDFRVAAKAHAEAVLRVEPGIVAFHAVSEVNDPARFRILEIYQDADAYRAHLQQPYFRAFLAATERMTTSRLVEDTVPVRLGAKPRLTASPVVRVAEIEIDAVQLQAYEAAVSEVNVDSIRLEPGVLTIYAVALGRAPTHLRFFEVYADDAAYRSHIASPHFRKYVETTKDMITSRRLIETHPLFLNLRQPR